MALYRGAQLPSSSIFSQRKSSYLYRLVPSGFTYRDRTRQRGMTIRDVVLMLTNFDR